MVNLLKGQTPPSTAARQAKVEEAAVNAWKWHRDYSSLADFMAGVKTEACVETLLAQGAPMPLVHFVIAAGKARRIANAAKREADAAAAKGTDAAPVAETPAQTARRLMAAAG